MNFPTTGTDVPPNVAEIESSEAAANAGSTPSAEQTAPAEQTPAVEQTLPVEHKGQTFTGLVAAEDERLCTLRFHSAKGIMPPGTKIFMPLLHGMGPITSHAGSMLSTLNVLTGSKKRAHRSQSLKALRNLPQYQLVGAEAIDLLGCHGRPIPEEQQTLDYFVEWLRCWLSPLKESLGVPIIPIARSASAAAILQLHATCPDLIDGLVLLSPMLPFDAEHSNADLLKRVNAGECELNHVAFNFMNQLVAQTDWDQQDDPFNGLPTLILTGEYDTQVSDRVRARCQEWHDALPHVNFYNLSETGHDVFNLRERTAGLHAFETMYCFLSEVCGDLATRS